MRAAPAAALVVVLACGPGTGQWRAVSRGHPTSSAQLDDVPVCGHRVEVKGAPPYAGVEGELLAAEEQRLVVLGREGVIEVRRDAATTIVVDVLPRRTSAAVAVVVVGTLSTLSHGAFLLLSAPVWLIGGVASVGLTVGEERWRFLPQSEALRDYARFPQGLPLGWPQEGARPRPCPSDEEPPPSGSAR